MDVAKKNTEAYQALLQVEESERTFKSRQGHNTAYALSLFIPPLGVYYFIKYVFFGNGTWSDKKAGIVSLTLTIASSIIALFFVEKLLMQTAVLLPREHDDVVIELITPGNEEKIKKLLQ